MKFGRLAEIYQRLEATSKRGEIRALLVEMLGEAAPKELPELLYFSQGLLRPEYEGIELGMADSLVKRAVAAATGAGPAEIDRSLRSSGDLGTTAAALLEGRTGRRLEERSVTEVYRGFRAIAEASGTGSQETKVQRLTELLAGASPAEAKYLARFAVGQLRLGVRELTILDALAQVYGGGTKEARARIEGSFNVCSDLGRVAQALADQGLEGLGGIRLTVGRPIRPMLAERSTTLAGALERMKGSAALEYKYDGLRIQAHIPEEGRPTLFSRRLENIGAQFPELLEELPSAIRRRPAIVEGECVSVDLDTGELQPFQEISRRRGRKYDLERMRAEVPVRLFLFDVLLEGSTEVSDQDFPERRKRLEALLEETDRIRLATQQVVHDLAPATEFFDQAISEGCEGVMVKSLAAGSRYRAGARGFWWIKYKREYTHTLGDSIDGVVVGAFFGRGRRAGVYGALLLAAYDPASDRYESFCKVGSGFDDATLAELPKRLHGLESATPPKEVATGLAPEVWFHPKLVLEVRGAELSLSPIHRAGFGSLRPGTGFALRFPRFTGRFRDDKGPQEATTVQELRTLYRNQVRQAAATTADEPTEAS